VQQISPRVLQLFRTRGLFWFHLIVPEGQRVVSLLYILAPQLHFHVVQFNVDNEPKDINLMKFVLSAIVDIELNDMEMQLRCQDIEERYDTLALWNYEVEPEEATRAKQLQDTWRDLLHYAKSKDLRMVKKKEDQTQSSIIYCLLRVICSL
jgi:hypothetical protein